jgi:hypothetical protein
LLSSEGEFLTQEQALGKEGSQMLDRCRFTLVGQLAEEMEGKKGWH